MPIEFWLFIAASVVGAVIAGMTAPENARRLAISIHDKFWVLLSVTLVLLAGVNLGCVLERLRTEAAGIEVAAELPDNAFEAWGLWWPTSIIIAILVFCHALVLAAKYSGDDQ